MHILIAMTRAVRLSGLPPLQRHILIALADRADAEGVTWPGLNKIAADTGYGRSSILRALDALEGAGIVARRRRADEDGRQTSNLYRVDPTLVPAREGVTTTPPLPTTTPWGRVSPRNGGGCRGDTGEGVVVTPEDPHLEDTQKKIPTSARAPRAPGSGRASKGKAEKAPKAKREVTAEEQAGRGLVLAAYRESFKAARGDEPITDAGRSPALALQLVRMVGAEKAVEMVRGAFTNSSTKGWASLLKIVSDPDRFVGATASASKHQVQPTTDSAWSVNGGAGLDNGEAA